MRQWREKDITAENINEVLLFCLEAESHCINLVQYLQEEKQELKNKLSLFCLTKRKIPLAKAFYLDGKIGAVACINHHQFFLYCVSDKIVNIQRDEPFGLESQKSELWLLMAKAFPLSKVYALMGEETVQTRLKELFLSNNKIKPTHVIHYILMIYDLDLLQETTKKTVSSEAHLDFVNAKPLRDKIVTRQASIADATSLLPLQIEYEKEEVCKSEKPFPPYVSMMNLQKILKDEIAYISTLDGQPIAKANTNARGINWQQLGGIYTLPKYRRRGVGSLTVFALLQHILKFEKKKIALFVNIENTAAIAMYKKLNFINAGKFMISYFR